MEELLTKSEDLRKVRAALLNVLEDTDELRRSAVDERNKTMAIIENLTDGVILLNKKKQIEIINSPATELFNIGKKEAIGKCFVDLLDIENIPEIKKILIDKDRIRNIYREEVATLDGLHLEITSVLLKDEIEEKGFLIIIHDVTKEKLIEKMKTEFVSAAAHACSFPSSPRILTYASELLISNGFLPAIFSSATLFMISSIDRKSVV